MIDTIASDRKLKDILLPDLFLVLISNDTRWVLTSAHRVMYSVEQFHNYNSSCTNDSDRAEIISEVAVFHDLKARDILSNDRKLYLISQFSIYPVLTPCFP
jgi:hypothetical protein